MIDNKKFNTNSSKLYTFCEFNRTSKNYQDLDMPLLKNKFQFQGSQSLQGVQLWRGKEAAQPIFEGEVQD